MCDQPQRITTMMFSATGMFGADELPLERRANNPSPLPRSRLLKNCRRKMTF